MHVASHLKQREGWSKTLTLRFGADDLEELGLRRTAARDGLILLESAGLAVVERGTGRKPVVRLAVPDAMARVRDSGGTRRRPMMLPIPWGWWTRAATAPGPGLPVTLALWFQAGWLGNRASFSLGTSDWVDFGLSRHMIGRGLTALEAAGLIAVDRRPGRPSVVTVLEAPPAYIRLPLSDG